jgi:hypothetical protein
VKDIKRYQAVAGLALGLLLGVLSAVPLAAQDYGSRLGTVKRGGKVTFEPTGPGIVFDALDPALRKWYVPQELYTEYQWKQWEYSNYARENYQRYVNTSIEGDYYYDLYGNFLTRGWLIFDWRQQNPQPFGSSLFKSGLFRQWFNNLVVASDHKGQYHYSISVGNQIRTTLTPLTFSKPLFNGVQIDLASDKYEATVLLSRAGEPDPIAGAGGPSGSRRTSVTNMFGGRVEVQVGDFVKVGGTLVNAHHTHTQADALTGDFIEGNLVGAQNLENISFVEILIKDDSPEDGDAGGALFASDIIIYDVDGNQSRGSEIGFRPLIEGGFQRRGFLSADGAETIRLRYDFLDRSYTGPDLAQIKRVVLEVVAANDYLIEMSSDRQFDFFGNQVFLTVARAPGNVKDSSNQRVLRFDYGLPTSNQVAGFTLEVDDFAGFKGNFEFNINQRYRKYPNPNREKHVSATARSEAWTANLQKVSYPYFAYGEAFHLDPDYSTGFTVVNTSGSVDYGNELRRYEFVDDNDDQDRLPDWRRHGFTSGDNEIFPGWDENNDFVSDFNQNDSPDSPSRLPDYEEPFLRFHTDRPEFLYGVDMNHNGTIDRFENDEEADYPYKLDREGFNLYGGTYLGPQTRLTVGHSRIQQLSDDREAETTYLLVTSERQWRGRARLRLFQDLRKVEDNIRDDLVQWVQPPNSRGELQPVLDALPAQDTWVNTTWLGFDLDPIAGLKLKNAVKWQFLRQLDSDNDLLLRGMRQGSSFFGLINKAEYQVQLGKYTLIPAWKSEFRRQTPTLSKDARRRELSQIFLVIGRLPLFLSSYIEVGAEYHIFRQLQNPTPPRADDSFNEQTFLGQLTDISDYQGYRLTTVLGFSVSRQHFKIEGTRTITRGFLTVYAGIER